MAKERPKTWWQVLKQTYMEWSEDRASTLAAALSYTAIFSLAPIVVVAVFVAGLVLGRHSGARAAVHNQVASFGGENTAKFMDDVIQKTYETATGNSGIWVSILATLLLLYAATNLFTTLQDSLNVVWHVERHPKSSWLGMLRARMWTFLMVACVGILLLGSVILSTYLTGSKSIFGGMSPWVGRIIEPVVSILIFTSLFALIMKLLPDAIVEWRDVFVGAAFTAVLFTIGKYLLAMYLTRASVTSSFGAAGSLVVVMLFIYYSSQIFFLGAEFTSVYARRTGSPIRPAEGAVCVEEARRFEEEEKIKKGFKEKEPDPFHGKARRDPGRTITIKSDEMPLRPQNPPERFNLPGLTRRA